MKTTAEPTTLEQQPESPINVNGTRQPVPKSGDPLLVAPANDPNEVARIAGINERPHFGWLGRYRVVAEIFLLAIVMFTALRCVMVLAFGAYSEISAWELGQLFVTGLRFDILIGLCLILPQTIHLTVFGNRLVMGRLSWALLNFQWVFAFLFLPLVCIAEVIFFDEYQSRLNYIAFEYLVYPTEVCCNIWESYPTFKLLSVVALIGGAAFVTFRGRFLAILHTPLSWKRRWGLLASLVTGIAAMWSSMGMSSMEISSNRVANECAGNGVYSFVYYAWSCRFDFEDFYMTVPAVEAAERVRARVAEPSDQLHATSANPIDRTIHQSLPQKDWNVVIVLEESFGSDFVGVLGDDRGLTPCFDALTKRGLLFDNFYATGNRTARALEAVLTSLPPIPTESILKRDHSDNVFTLAHVLEKRGYERLFMTGGRGLFDGVRSFMTNNGFNEFIEQSDFDDPKFSNAWGVSDEDLFDRAIVELDRLHQSGKPFFATLLTVSNHRPFTYPEGRIPETTPSRENAVKYADWSLGHFFEMVETREFRKNTIFLVMGDHGARIYGSQAFPMKSYRVPVVMLLPTGERAGTRCDTLACLLDIAPTVMGQLGGDYRSVFFGHDALTVRREEGYAVMQHNHDLALLTADHRIVMLGSRKNATGYDMDPLTWELKQLPQPDPQLLLDTISLFQKANRLYYDDQCIPGESPATIATIPTDSAR